MKTCLNLGSGLDYRESTETETWINADNDKHVKTDWCGDASYMPDKLLSIATGCEDWTNKFDYIYANHVLEHFPDLFAIVDELARVSKNNAIWEVNVPYWSWPRNQGNPHHKIHFSEDTFRFFDQGPNGLHKRRQQNYSIETVEVKYVWNENYSPQIIMIDDGVPDMEGAYMRDKDFYLAVVREIKFKLKLTK